jgi:hypothetical protein
VKISEMDSFDYKRTCWIDSERASVLHIPGQSGDACVWQRADTSQFWVSNTPPVLSPVLYGEWPTREEGKLAILTALRNYHVNLLAKIEALMIEDAKTEPAA